MRVISGRLRSRKLHAPRGEQTRPTHDRVKEALFSVLGSVAGYNVVDLYAGTGALGIEALSRGARHACFVERRKEALDCLRRNLDELALTNETTVLPRSVESVQLELLRLGPFDLVFCDPPWRDIETVISLLSKLTPSRWLSADGALVLEHPERFQPVGMSIQGLSTTDRRHWGDTAVTFYAPDRSGGVPADDSNRS